MSFELALRLTEVLVGFAILQASLEQIASPSWARGLFAARAGLAALLMLGLAPLWTGLGVLALSIAILHRFDGPTNGGADRMALLVLCGLTAAHAAPAGRWAEIAFGYPAAQLVLSYVFSGWVKLVNPDWRSGRALADVFAFSAYPVSEDLRALADCPRLLLATSWAVIGFELIFPLALFSPVALSAALGIGLAFHLANAVLFGLNRFVWAWIAAYPGIWWLQGRILGGG